MTTTQILVVAFAAIAMMLTAAIFTIAWRRAPSEPGVGRLDKAARARDRSRLAAPVPDPVRELEPARVGVEAPPPPDPLEVRPVVDAETYDVTRRQFFNRGIIGIFSIFMAQFALASLAFMWPKLRSGGFGSKVNAGKVADLEALVFSADGRVQPLFLSAAQAYVVPFRGTLEGSSFDGRPVIAGGLMALWQRCVHLGCRVPPCNASQGFECPCHGSKYNYHGEYEDGPAPRNLDRFVIEVNEDDELIIDTGTVIQTARASQKTIEYPQGPTCI